MYEYEFAQVREQEDDLIIVPLDSSFDSKSSHDQRAWIRTLQRHASSAGFAGTVVPVWLVDDEGMKFTAPPKHHLFLQGLNWDWVMGNLNGKIIC